MQLFREFKGKGNHWLRAGIVISILTALILGPGCSQEGNLSFETVYQAVVLDNGQIYIGKLEQGGSAYPLLREVFYVRQVEGDKKEVKNILIKRGGEWHKPEYMRINGRHIVMIEPVSPESHMAQLIKEAKTLPPAAPPSAPPPVAPAAPSIPKEGPKPPAGK